MNEARIKLAEAMGWRFCHSAQIPTGGYKKTQPCWMQPGSELIGEYEQLPDPFTDANDDYAVLEWARKQWRGETLASFWKDKEQWTAFVFRLNLTWMDDGENYKIGDYARATCKVLDID